jgi:predicted anti-sigma-YlaC factor YlaD
MQTYRCKLDKKISDGVLMEYVDGTLEELEPKKHEYVKKHLKECNSCRTEALKWFDFRKKFILGIQAIRDEKCPNPITFLEYMNGTLKKTTKEYKNIEKHLKTCWMCQLDEKMYKFDEKMYKSAK